jgi:hypothetical protein
MNLGQLTAVAGTVLHTFVFITFFSATEALAACRQQCRTVPKITYSSCPQRECKYVMTGARSGQVVCHTPMRPCARTHYVQQCDGRIACDSANELFRNRATRRH